MTTLEATVTVTVIATSRVDTGRVHWTVAKLTLVHVYTHTHTHTLTDRQTD